MVRFLLGLCGAQALRVQRYGATHASRGLQRYGATHASRGLQRYLSLIHI